MKKSQRFRYAALLAVLMTAFVMPVGAMGANTEKDIGSFGSWRTYTYDEGGQTVCYMVTTKTIKSKGPSKRVAPYLMITHRPVEASTDVFSYGAGTLLDAKHDVHVQIDKTSFDLFSVRDNAWARDALTDHKLATALRGAASAQVFGISSQGRIETISDQFDLTGALPAYRAIGKACGLPDVEVKKAEVKKPVAKKGAVQKPVVKKPIFKKPTTNNTPSKKTISAHPKR